MTGYRCSHASKDRGQAVKSIGDAAFHDKNLTSVVIPNSVTSIRKYALSYNDNLTSLVIGDNMNLGRFAFGNTNLTSVNTGDNVDISPLTISVNGEGLETL